MKIPFSVLLSVYKNENASFLNDSLSSLFNNHNYLPDEVVLIEDGELPPELNNVISIWKKNKPNIFKTIHLENNVGLGNALNIGMLHCTHSWIFRMDTDDVCHNERFAKQIEYIRSNPNIVLLGSHTEEFNFNMSNSLGLRSVPKHHDEIKQYIKKRNPFNHMTVAFRKDVIQAVGGYKHHLYMEDYNLWIRVIAAGYQVGNIDEVLVNVRGGDSMVRRRKGLVYIKSELQLARLKIEKNIDSPLSAYSNFIIRSIPRLLPTYMLSKVYKKLRK